MTRAEPSPYALSAGRALTHSPLVLVEQAILGAEPAAIFAFISDFAGLPAWMPLIKRCTVDNRQAERPGERGAVRQIEPILGGRTDEQVVAFEPGRMLAYHATDATLRGLYRGHLGVLTTEPHLERGTRFTWLTFARPGPLPMRWLGPAVFSYVVRHSIANLERLFPARRWS